MAKMSFIFWYASARRNAREIFFFFLVTLNWINFLATIGLEGCKFRVAGVEDALNFVNGLNQKEERNAIESVGRENVAIKRTFFFLCG